MTYADLSALRHEVAVADGPPFRSPEFLVIRFFGSYRDGSAGKDDALYIVAAATAARKAWWSRSTILDLRELEYQWGDEMGWITSVVWDPILRADEPLALVVGDACRNALRSLLREEYERFCVESLEQAFASCREQARVYEQRLKDFRDRA